MADIDKIVDGLRCISGQNILCKDCAYSDDDGYGRGKKCQQDCIRDAITALQGYELSEVVNHIAMERISKQMAQIEETADKLLTAFQNRIGGSLCFACKYRYRSVLDHPCDECGSPKFKYFEPIYEESDDGEKAC